MLRVVFYCFFVAVLSIQATAQEHLSEVSNEVDYFLKLNDATTKTDQELYLNKIKEHWKPSFEIMALESMYFNYNNNKGTRLLLLLNKKTNQNLGFDFNAWYYYLWNKPQELHTDYARFKAEIHKDIDPKFEKYFKDRQLDSHIRLDEIRWGGVVQDGIPPLRKPEMINAEQATYLEDDHIIFGISVNGDIRAYPKRILAWHEMFTDTVGDISVTGVYCTLCGTVILYNNTLGDKTYTLGTSGFLYRSNKLMYDKKTQSMWSTLEGKPVVGPLVGKDIQLDYMSVVTTTWGEWKALHPDTKILSLETGHRRDYGEGVAYQDYFNNDVLMFNTPSVDKSLKNKQSIFAITLEEYPNEQLAISTKLLQKKRIYSIKIKDKELTVLTDQNGGNRLYETGDLVLKKYISAYEVVDSKNNIWKITETHLENGSKKLDRVPAFNAFWFGWKAAYPKTKLIK